MELIKEIGTSLNIEYRNESKQMRISYCYMGKLKNINDYINPTEDEKDYGMVYKWHDLEQAIKNIEEDAPVGYTGFPYNMVRELEFLNKYKELMSR